METILLGNILTAVICLPFIINAAYDTISIVGVTALGVIQFGIPYVLYGIAIKHVRALDAVMIAAIEPILNPIWVLVFLGEKPGFWALIGGAIVMASVTYNCIQSTVSKNKTEDYSS